MTQITLGELLQDPEYKKYFLTVPKLPEHYKGTKPWRLYLLVKGTKVWRTKRFETYKEAVLAYKKYRNKLDDAVINCPGLGFRPPLKTVKLKRPDFVRGKEVPALRTQIWRPKLDSSHDAHTWCSYCRRPTVWKFLAGRLKTAHGNNVITDYRRRCTICSATEEIVNVKHPEKEQGWDSSRATIYPIINK